MKITFRKIDRSFLRFFQNRSLFYPILYIFYVSVFGVSFLFLLSLFVHAESIQLSASFMKFASCHICFSVCCYYFCPFLASQCDWSDLCIQIHCVVAQYVSDFLRPSYRNTNKSSFLKKNPSYWVSLSARRI